MADLEACRVTDEAVVVGLYPDVCLTPPGPTPVPYMVVARFSDGVRSRPTVRFRGVEAMTDFGRLSRVYGDEAGVGGGLTSGVNMGTCRPQTYSSSVRINGQAVVRHDDSVEMNCAGPDGPANTVGKVMYVPVGAPLPVGPMGEVAGDTNPPVELETEEEKGFWARMGDGLATAGEHTVGFVKGAAGGVKDLAVGAYEIGKFGVQSGAIGFLTDREQFYENWNAIGNAGQGAANWVPTIWNEPGQAWADTKGVLGMIVEPITEPWGRGAYGEAIGRGAFEVAALVFGAKGLDKLLKGGRTARAVEEAAGLADDVARSAADDAARAAASGADDAARAGADGLQVTGRSLIEQRASRYSDLVNSNEAWTWDDIAEGLSRSERREIRQAAIDDGLIPNVPVDPVTRFADFGDLVETEIPLPRELWSGTRNTHFSYLDKQYLQRTGVARPNTMTWHHHQDPGRMQLVPRGVHNAYNHNGGMSVWGGSNAPPSP